MESIKRDLQTGNFKQAYLLYGEESYLKRTYKNKLLKALIQPGDTMNFASYEGKDVEEEIPRIIDLAETLPFFAERRVILIEDASLKCGYPFHLSAHNPCMPFSSDPQLNHRLH